MKKDILAQKLEQQLRTVAAERLAAKREPGLLASRTALKQYQAARLASSHADLLAHPNTGDAARFFLEELYGSQDLSQRDIDLGRIIPTLQKMLTYEALHTITDAIVLDALSEQLDTAMARVLGTEFTEGMYIAAYRTATTREERLRQLDLVQELGGSLCDLVNIPLLAMTLTIMKGPARVAGLSNLHKFLERGFTTFKKMRKPRDFVATIVARERQVMENIFEGRMDSFGQ
ncbi:hypothetical protein KY495_00710 [Massilia sp. PAMC28688]|uniref:FFLEELY motif protein n=1 Tax=Massilia sp. PAMC28688 TaxID=2861283 RepID=UPI001C628BAE|nr:hypothetical protein [Massilia sp. PAMC28688]QYF93797.1 hypothetical protein KY495_00710 [Massilia sp. PAMC28688]